MATAHTGADVLAAGLMLSEQDRAQGSFAFNRARKCLIQLGLVETNAFKPYGMMGKQKAAFHHLIQMLPEDAVARVKSAMMMTAEDWRAPRIRHRARRGRDTSDEEVASEEEAESASHAQTAEQLAYNAPHLYSLDFPTPSTAAASAPTSVPASAPITPASSTAIAESFKHSRKTTKAEEAEILRSLQAARLADAMKHESFKMLEPEQQAAIKARWLQTLMN